MSTDARKNTIYIICITVYICHCISGVAGSSEHFFVFLPLNGERIIGDKYRRDGKITGERGGEDK